MKYVMALASLQEFVRKAENLAEKFEKLKPTVYNEETVSTLYKCLPFSMRNVFLRTIEENDLERAKLEKLKTFLEKEKVYAREACTMETCTAKTPAPRGSANFSKERGGGNRQYHNCYEDDGTYWVVRRL